MENSRVENKANMMVVLKSFAARIKDAFSGFIVDDEEKVEEFQNTLKKVQESSEENIKARQSRKTEVLRIKNITVNEIYKNPHIEINNTDKDKGKTR